MQTVESVSLWSPASVCDRIRAYLKSHPEETWESVLERLIDAYLQREKMN